MEKQPLNKELTPEEKAKARTQAEMILAESKASKKNFPMGSPMSEKEFTDWYIKNKERLAAVEKELTPEERIRVNARSEAEMFLAEAKAQGLELETSITEETFIKEYVEARVKLWKEWISNDDWSSHRFAFMRKV